MGPEDNHMLLFIIPNWDNCIDLLCILEDKIPKIGVQCPILKQSNRRIVHEGHQQDSVHVRLRDIFAEVQYNLHFGRPDVQDMSNNENASGCEGS